MLAVSYLTTPKNLKLQAKNFGKNIFPGELILEIEETRRFS